MKKPKGKAKDLLGAFAEEVKKVSGVVAVVPKRWFWMLPLDSNQKDSIFRKLKFNDRRQSELAKRIFQL